MIGASTAPDRLGLSDSRAAARHKRDARPSMCTSHAHACDRMIAPNRRPHSVACTECGRSASQCMASAWRTFQHRSVITLTAIGTTMAQQTSYIVLGEPVGRIGDEPDEGRGRHDGLAWWRAGVWPRTAHYRDTEYCMRFRFVSAVYL